MAPAKQIIAVIREQTNPKKAKLLQGFFKTGPGQYGEGDIFWGLTVPQSRLIAKKYKDLNLVETKKLLQSKIHEIRLIALLILVEKFTHPTLKLRMVNQKNIVNFYLKNIKYINNWDLVDLTASKILGTWLLDKDPAILYKLVKSKNLWERRIAMIATYAFIKKNNFKHTLKLAEILLNDQHDLMHKAVGWMLREMGKQSKVDLINFLGKYTLKMPRTMLRYSIERLPEKQRKLYLNKK